MEEYQKRVIEEQKELAIKLNNLTNMLTSEKYYDLHFSDQTILYKQLYIMIDYNRVLQERIEDFI